MTTDLVPSHLPRHMGADFLSPETVDPNTANYLRRRGLVLRSERSSTRVQVYLPGPIPVRVGWVDESRIANGWWRASWRPPGGAVPGDPPDPAGKSIDEAIRRIIDGAWYGDILVARERRFGTPVNYTATLYDGGARQLASFEDPELDEHDIEYEGNGTIRLTHIAVAYYRGSPCTSWNVDDNNRLWAGYEDSYPLIPDP